MSLKRSMVLLTFFYLGGASMIIQAVVIREFLVVFYGNELCMGTIFGVWLFSIAIGAYICVLFSGKIIRILGIFLGLVFLFSILPFLQVFLIRSARVYLSIPSGLAIPFFKMFIITFVVIIPYGLIVGSIFPLGCKLYASSEEDRQSIASVFCVESMGALAGGVTFSYVLVERFSPFIILWGLLVIFWLIVGMHGLLLLRGKLAIIFTVFTVLFISGAFLVMPLVKKMEHGTLEIRWNSLVTGLPLIASHDSKYQNLTLTKQEDQYSIYGNGEYSFSFPDPYQDKIIANLLLAEHPRPRKLLIIGMASGGFILECLKHRIESLHYVLLDEAVMNMMRPYLDCNEKSGFENSKVKIFYTDGRYWVNQTKELYDCVFLLVPDPSNSMINRFYTKEFFISLRKVMNKGSILALSLSSSSNYLGSEITEYNLSLYNTLIVVFPFVEISPGERNYYFASLSPSVVTSDIKVLKKRIALRGIKETDFSPFLFEDLFYPERVAFVKNAFRGKVARLNSDLQPVSYFYNLIIWDKISGSTMAFLFSSLESLRLSTVLCVLLLLLLARAGYVIARKIDKKAQEKFNILSAVGIFGFSAMGIELVLIFSYQNMFGYLYQMIGVLMASFMFGLSAGSFSGKELLKRRSGHIRLFIVIQLLLIIFSIIIPFMLKMFSQYMLNVISFGMSQMLFVAGIMIMGFFNGLVFPMASDLFINREPHLVKVAGFINAIDHLGASIGGFAFGTFFVPLLGICYSCYLVAILGLAGVALWLIIPLSRLFCVKKR